MRFRVAPTNEQVELDVEIVIAAGYTGRDQAEVRAHVAELESHGVDPPDTVPCFYVIPPTLLTQAERVVVSGERSSGEAEVAIFSGPKGTFVTVASDHTDREIERFDVQTAKLCCPKIVGTTVWRLEDVRDHWDELVLIAAVGAQGDTPYQHATLGDLVAPADLLGMIPWRARPRSFVVLSGTVSTQGGLNCDPHFRVELRDERLGRSLALRYEAVVSRQLVTPLPPPESASRIRAAAHRLGTSLRPERAVVLGRTLERLELALVP